MSYSNQACLAPKLFAHQKEPARYLYRNRNTPNSAYRRIMLYMQMGCGKSAALAECIMTIQCNSIIAVPPAVVSNMQNELRVCGFESTGGERGIKDILVPSEAIGTSNEFEVFLITHNAIKDLFESKHRMFEGEYLIAYDESQFLRNVSTFHRTNDAVEATNDAKYVILMTGTPMHTQVSDLYPQLYAMDAVDGHLNKPDAHHFQAQLTTMSAALRYFTRLRRKGTMIFFHRNSSRCSNFAKFVTVPDHRIEPSERMQMLVDYMKAKKTGPVPDFVQNFVNVYTKKKERKNKRLSDTDIWYMSSNVDFNSKTLAPRPCPKTLRMCEYIATQSHLPVMILCPRRQLIFGGVDMVARCLEKMGQSTVLQDNKRLHARAKRTALVTAVKTLETSDPKPDAAVVVSMHTDNTQPEKLTQMRQNLSLSIQDTSYQRQYLTVGISPQADMQKVDVGAVVTNPRRLGMKMKIAQVDKIPQPDGTDKAFVRLETIGPALRNMAPVDEEHSVEVVTWKDHLKRQQRSRKEQKEAFRQLSKLDKKLNAALPPMVDVMEPVVGVQFTQGKTKYTITELHYGDTLFVDVTDNHNNKSTMRVLTRKEYLSHVKNIRALQKARERLRKFDYTNSDVTFMQPRKLRVLTLVGGDDHEHVLTAFANGDVDVIITTLKEGYSLSCKIPGTADEYEPDCVPLREVHFATPPTSLGDRLQFEARGNRLLSHAQLPTAEQQIEVHTWVTVAGNGHLPSFDTSSINSANARAKDIRRVESAIQQVYGNEHATAKKLGPEHTHKRYCRVGSQHMAIQPDGEHVLVDTLPDPYNDNAFYEWFREQHGDSTVTKAKRKRPENESDENPCAVHKNNETIRKPECENNKAITDPVSWEVIPIGKGMCHSTKCWDFDSFAESVISHRNLNPLNRQPVNLEQTYQTMLPDRQDVLETVQSDGLLLKYFSPEMRADHEVVMKAVAQNGTALRYASPALQSQIMIVRTAFRQNPDALQFVPPHIRAIIYAENNNIAELQRLEIGQVDGVHIDEKDDLGNTALHMASAKGHLDVVKYLLTGYRNRASISAMATVNIYNNRGETPLHFAAENGYADIAEMLARFGADPRLPNQIGETALQWAEHTGHGATITEAVERGASERHLFINRLMLNARRRARSRHV